MINSLLWLHWVLTITPITNKSNHHVGNGKLVKSVIDLHIMDKSQKHNFDQNISIIKPLLFKYFYLNIQFKCRHYIIWGFSLPDKMIEYYINGYRKHYDLDNPWIWDSFMIFIMCFYFSGHTAITYILRYRWYFKTCMQHVLTRSCNQHLTAHLFML